MVGMIVMEMTDDAVDGRRDKNSSHEIKCKQMQI